MLVTESRFAVIPLLWLLSRLAQPIGRITRLRLDAARSETRPPLATTATPLLGLIATA